ncbi:hypothetical protein FOMPIDRAFT_1055210 [Fomitopsis schrenkii]|uniref:Uncharacterized protein n=1 Tax=Fomitopsis schrenkii TaxID=2126942 RepID=S8DL70_FOMSC|nr:hypothetical protein FOMPIDRAFT_1055210 [Fomitopsis schrenkii]
MAVTRITVHPAQQCKGSKFWAHHPRERELGEAQWLEARTDGSAPLPSYSLHDPEPENGPRTQEIEGPGTSPREFDEELFGREVFDWEDLE